MNSLGVFLGVRRKELSLSIAKLAELAEMSAPITHKYVTGERVMPKERAATIRRLLCPTSDLQAEFDELYERSLLARKRNSPLEIATDQRTKRIRAATLDYPPFAGEPERFVDMFVSNALKMAQIPLDTVHQEINPQGTGHLFNVGGRIEAVNRREVELVYGLASLDRARHLSFIELPIRVAVAAVLFSPLRESEDATKARLRMGRNLLIDGEQPKKEQPWQVLAVRGEIAHIFLQETHGLEEVPWADQPKPQQNTGHEASKRCLYLLDTLDPQILALRLRHLSKVAPSMLCCDENTAMLVLKELSKDSGGIGQLVLAPNSDQAVIHSDRKIPPAYYFGIGMRRDNNWPLIDYMRGMFSSFLNVEGERIAEWYEALYAEMVKQNKACLSATGVFVGGIRRTSHLLDGPSASGTDPGEWRATLDTLLDQHARAIARRSLSLSRRALESLPLGFSDWKPILMRARERIQIADGGDRGRIRNLIFYCARIALGRSVVPHPMDANQVSEDSLKLLRALTRSHPAHEEQGSLGVNTFVAKQASECWDTFIYLMELELDMDLREVKDCEERFFRDSSDLGDLISRIQLLLEASRDSQLALTVRPYDPEIDRDGFAVLLEEYLQRAKSSKELDSWRARMEADCTDRVRFVAWHLGEAVGFLDAILCPAEEESAMHGRNVTERQAFSRGTTLRVDDLHVTDHMHHVGVSRRLIRRIVEKGNREHRQAVWIQLDQWPEPADQRKFQRTGFRQSATGDRLLYRFIVQGTDVNRF